MLCHIHRSEWTAKRSKRRNSILSIYFKKFDVLRIAIKIIHFNHVIIDGICQTSSKRSIIRWEKNFSKDDINPDNYKVTIQNSLQHSKKRENPILLVWPRDYARRLQKSHKSTATKRYLAKRAFSFKRNI